MVAAARNSQQARVRARRSAVQALYQWFLTGEPMAGIISEFERDRKELKKADKGVFPGDPVRNLN